MAFKLQPPFILCSYVWGVLDILVLPPSFPSGGMENPCLTFVTPTIIAGDKSLTNVIAHEIAVTLLRSGNPNKFTVTFFNFSIPGVEIWSLTKTLNIFGSMKESQSTLSVEF